MAGKFVLLAAACLAQGFAHQHFSTLRGKDGCRNPAAEIPFEFEETMHEMDEVRESVSMAAMEAYAQGNDFEVIIACFREQEQSYIELGEHLSEMVRSASEEMSEKLGEKADKYTKIMEVPLRNIALTMRDFPERIYNFIKNKEFSKAAEAMKEARKIIEENSIVLGQAIKQMTSEIPELADRAEQMAQEIRSEARKGCEAISAAFRKCVKEGGPKEPLAEAK